MTTTGLRLRVEGQMPALDGGAGWLNSEPLTTAGLRGRVVLVQFWTYTCINWLRSLPYVRAWSERYRDRGLVVIGVHTPEFSFERDLDNVRRAVASMGITYPVVLDSDYVIWEAFANRYWPALYFVDALGRVRHHAFGEGDYERSELVIRELLAEAGADLAGDQPLPVVAPGPEAPADWDDLGSGETYLGYGRAEHFASPHGLVPDEPRTYSIPSRLRLNSWALSGNWVVRSEAAALQTADGRIAHRFHARDLHLVMGAAIRGRSVPFRVLLDGQPPGAAHGGDADGGGAGAVGDQRLYQLIRQPGAIADRLFEIHFPEPGVEAVVFTFG
jgi:thiol-disulfide isomerase/thioredoxin